MILQVQPNDVVKWLSSDVNLIGHTKVQIKSWNDTQTSENVQNLEFLPINTVTVRTGSN